MPRWLMGLLVLVSVPAFSVQLAGRSRIRVEHAPETFLLTGAGFALVAGSALNHFEPRFLIPAAPLLVSSGTVAARDLVTAVRRRRVATDSSALGAGLD